jgi:tRNA pseudouridine55 synthase
MLGKSTDSGDREGEPIELWSKEQVGSFYLSNQDIIKSRISDFTSIDSQTPPKISAIKLNGKRSSDLFREGIEPKIKSRPVKIYSSKIIESNSEYIEFDVRVSSGTYIRKLIIDLSNELNFPMHLDKLVRTSIHKWSIETSVQLDDLKENPNQFKSVKEMLKLPIKQVDMEEIDKVKKGVRIQIDLPPEGEFWIEGSDSRIYARCLSKSTLTYSYIKVFPDGI